MYLHSSASPHLIDPRVLREIQNAYFSHLTHTKQLLLMTFCNNTAGIVGSFRTHGNTDRKTDGWTDKHGIWNSYLDCNISLLWLTCTEVPQIVWTQLLSMDSTTVGLKINTHFREFDIKSVFVYLVWIFN